MNVKTIFTNFKLPPAILTGVVVALASLRRQFEVVGALVMARIAYAVGVFDANCLADADRISTTRKRAKAGAIGAVLIYLESVAAMLADLLDARRFPRFNLTRSGAEARRATGANSVSLAANSTGLFVARCRASYGVTLWRTVAPMGTRFMPELGITSRAMCNHVRIIPRCCDYLCARQGAS
jgi:hypothetical protein